LVLDIGTCLVKAGYAGDDVPKAVFPSVSRGISTHVLLISKPKNLANDLHFRLLGLKQAPRKTVLEPYRQAGSFMWGTQL